MTISQQHQGFDYGYERFKCKLALGLIGYNLIIDLSIVSCKRKLTHKETIVNQKNRYLCIWKYINSPLMENEPLRLDDGSGGNDEVVTEKYTKQLGVKIIAQN